MSKNGGLGSKRIGSMTSKGMGKCEANSRAEQCGNGRGLTKGKGEYMDIEENLLIQDIAAPKPQDHLISIQKQLSSLEHELKKIKEKMNKLKGD